MFLPDILRLCDAFELRPGLVSTREIIDAYKKVPWLQSCRPGSLYKIWSRTTLPMIGRSVDDGWG